MDGQDRWVRDCVLHGNIQHSSSDNREEMYIKKKKLSKDLNKIIKTAAIKVKIKTEEKWTKSMSEKLMKVIGRQGRH